MPPTSTTISNQGHVYVLTSPNCEYIKIGGTDFAPLKRIREINRVEPYQSLGPWTLHDFRQVVDWRAVEHNLHYTFRSQLVETIAGQRELFSLAPVVASRHLDQIDEALLIRKPKVDRLFQDQDFLDYLILLFRVTGILNWVSLQGAWTLTLFPTTNGGRYFTLNIGRHEVAFSTIPMPSEASMNMIHMDRLIYDFLEVRQWVKARHGCFRDDIYETSLYRSTSVSFQGEFSDCREFLNLHGVRRAVIAYWTESLMNLQDRNTTSTFARYHNWNAVAALKKKIEAIRC